MFFFHQKDCIVLVHNKYNNASPVMFTVSVANDTVLHHTGLMAGLQQCMKVGLPDGSSMVEPTPYALQQTHHCPS